MKKKKTLSNEMSDAKDNALHFETYDDNSIWTDELYIHFVGKLVFCDH